MDNSQTFTVFVDYTMPRDRTTLEAEFSKNGVSELFFGSHEWFFHSSCVDIDQNPGERIMLVKHFGWLIESEDAIAEMDKQGYRPATHLEAYAFAKANPDLQRQFWILALGSFALDGDGVGRAVASLFDFADKRIFGLDWFGLGWRFDGRFLFVRK